MNGHGPVAPRALGPIGSLNRHSAGLGLPAQHQHPENNWVGCLPGGTASLPPAGICVIFVTTRRTPDDKKTLPQNGNGSQHDMYRDIDHYAPSNYGGSHAGYDQYGNGDYGQHGHDNGQHDYDGGYDQHQQGHPSYQQQQEQFQQQSAPKKPPARGIFCCFKPKAEEPESSLDKYHHEDGAPVRSGGRARWRHAVLCSARCTGGAVTGQLRPCGRKQEVTGRRCVSQCCSPHSRFAPLPLTQTGNSRRREPSPSMSQRPSSRTIPLSPSQSPPVDNPNRPRHVPQGHPGSAALLCAPPCPDELKCDS